MAPWTSLPAQPTSVLRCLSQLMLIQTIYRKTCFSLFKKLRRKQVFLWCEISFSAISKVKLKFYCILSVQEVIPISGSKVELGTWQNELGPKEIF